MTFISYIYRKIKSYVTENSLFIIRLLFCSFSETFALSAIVLLLVMVSKYLRPLKSHEIRILFTLVAEMRPLFERITSQRTTHSILNFVFFISMEIQLDFFILLVVFDALLLSK